MLSSDEHAPLYILLAIVFAAGTLIVKYLNQTDIPKIESLPELPGVPMFGSLFLLGKHHAMNCANFVKKYGPVFQARLGNRRVIYVNTFDSVRELFITTQGAIASRPRFWTFHNVVSQKAGITQGVFTLGTSPWSDSIKRARKAAGTALNRTAMLGYLPFIDLEITRAIGELLDNVAYQSDGGKGEVGGEINPQGYFQRFSLNISLTIGFGLRIQGNVKDELLWEIVEVERELANYRGVAHCWQDYVPLLRLFPGYKKKAIEYRARRDDYLLGFFNELRRRIDEGTDNPCIAGNVIKDPEAKLADNELKAISLTMVAAGLDTLPGNINMTMAYLSSPHGQQIQKDAYEEIMKAYENDDPWHECVNDERCEYMVSFTKEVLRYWSTLNLSFSRQSSRAIEYNGAVIPAEIPVFLNMWAANHDPTHFQHPHQFMPERFMPEHMPESDRKGGTQHFAYGAGTRNCLGNHIANRELYAMFIRLILAFHIKPTTVPKMYPELDTVKCNAVPTSMVTQPKQFQVYLVPREREKLGKWIQESWDATAHLK